jgi:hypothetical protein
VTRDELCGHLEAVRYQMECAYRYGDWADIDRAHEDLTRLQHRLRKADDFTVQGDWP